MQPFTLDRGRDIADTIRRGRIAGTDYIAGGTDLMQLLKDDVRRPAHLVDLEGLDLDRITVTPKGVRFGAMVRMSAVADHPDVIKDYPVISQALLASAAPQIRNLGTIGGNLLQRTRCPYFRDTAAACNKRVPGTGCSAIEGSHRTHAIFGGSRHCIATHASDLAVALVALDATVHLSGPGGARDLRLTELHLVPGDHPDIETMLHPGELILAISVPRRRLDAPVALSEGPRPRLVRVRADRRRGGARHPGRHHPRGARRGRWRRHQALAPARGRAGPARRAGDGVHLEARGPSLDRGATPLRDNQFKVRLLQNTVARALEQAGGQA
jgi:xanthine dehydrogenase YagS FAD-binding subunit